MRVGRREWSAPSWKAVATRPWGRTLGTCWLARLLFSQSTAELTGLQSTEATGSGVHRERERETKTINLHHITYPQHLYSTVQKALVDLGETHTSKNLYCCKVLQTAVCSLHPLEGNKGKSNSAFTEWSQGPLQLLRHSYIHTCILNIIATVLKDHRILVIDRSTGSFFFYIVWQLFSFILSKSSVCAVKLDF